MFQLRCQVEQVLLHVVVIAYYCFSFKCCWHNVWGLNRQRAAVEGRRERSVASAVLVGYHILVGVLKCFAAAVCGNQQAISDIVKR